MDRADVIDRTSLPAPESAVVEALVLDLLDWVADREPSYQEVMDAWRTSCPRLPVWEDANDRGLVARTVVDGRAAVRITPAGRALLARRNRPAGR
jgi:D-3-phosphoglycerate dehydrogenase